MPEQSRPETGTMQFGNDWPGIFIRGDSAVGFALSLQSALAENLDPNIRAITAAPAKGLVKLLFSCDTSVNPNAEQMLKPWAECVTGSMIFALIHGMEHANSDRDDEDCFGYYSSHALALKALNEYFKEMGDPPWAYDEQKKEWRKGDCYAYIEEHEMNKKID